MWAIKLRWGRESALLQCWVLHGRDSLGQGL